MKKTGKHRDFKTSEELYDELSKHPILKAHMDESRAKYREAARDLLEELRVAGFEVGAVGDLIAHFGHTGIPYTSAVPILMKWLPQVTYDALKDDIVRTLSVPWAKPAAARLMLEEFERVERAGLGHVRWAIGNALEVVADDSVFDDLVRIAMDRRYGRDREMVVLALGNMKDPRAVKVLIALLDDEGVAGHAVAALGKLRARKALPYLERFLQHPKTWVRNEAKKAIKAIKRSEGDSR